MDLRPSRRLAPALLCSGLAAWSASAGAAWELNMPRGVTPVAHEAYDLHMLTLWICVAIGVVVFGAMLISILSHRKSSGRAPAQFHHSTTAEIVWTVIPVLILVGMAIPATTALIAMEDTSDPDLTLKVTGYQWKWHYEYLDDGVSFYSNLASSSRSAIYEDPYQVEHYLLDVDNRVVVPVGAKVRILLTADDVIHAWWVPELGMKKDAIPGFVNEMWIRIEEPGVYRGQCAELCGKDHGFMPIVVEAKSAEGYKEWVAAQKTAQAEATQTAMATWDHGALMARGEQVYAQACAACHQLDGTGVAHNFPAIKGSPVATGTLDAHLRLVLDGRPGTAMRAFAGKLTDVELAAVLTYQRNAFGNATGDLVQPAEVAAARQTQLGG
jgi:cytochrome c oxidase subunit 2